VVKSLEQLRALPVNEQQAQSPSTAVPILGKP